MPRNRKKLTAQDAFIGVRRPEPPEVEPEAPAEPAPVAEKPVDEEVQPGEPATETPPKPASPKRRSARRAKSAPSSTAALAAALAEAQKALAERRATERLTLYLPPDLASQLDDLYTEVRSTTQVKVGKSVLAAAALRIVMADPARRAEAATLALKEKLGTD